MDEELNQIGRRTHKEVKRNRTSYRNLIRLMRLDFTPKRLDNVLSL